MMFFEGIEPEDTELFDSAESLESPCCIESTCRLNYRKE